MENLKIIAQKANDRLGKEVFRLKGDGLNTIMNHINRYEGNDIDMEEVSGKYVLTITGATEEYSTIDAAVQGLIDMYEPPARKQIRVSSVIILRWLTDNRTEVFQDVAKLYAKYSAEQLGITRRTLYQRDIDNTEHITATVGIKRSAIE